MISKKDKTIDSFMEKLDETMNFWKEEFKELRGYRFVMSWYDRYVCEFYIVFKLYDVMYRATFEMNDKGEWEAYVFSTIPEVAGIICDAIREELKEMKEMK